MPYYSDHKCIFIHIPKSAGSTIHSILKNKSCTVTSDHKTMYDLSLRRSTIKQCFKFTFVRNPWDRFVSTYFYFKKYGRDNLGDMMTGYIVNSFNSFRDFAINFPNIPNQLFRYPHFNEQVSWMQGQPPFDFIGRFENLQDDFNTVCNKLSIPVQKIPRLNPSRHGHYTKYYDNETREIVAERYAKDIEHFGYKFK